jgi:putative acetyltransferase
VRIRAEEETDQDAVHDINLSAFDTDAEANLVDALRKQASPIISLVAEDDGAIVGHIMFTPVSLSEALGLKMMGLGPMAVAPKHQRKGIGSELVRTGLAQCKQLGAGAVVVLGHPEYYPRFGFEPASRFGVDSEYDAPDDVFMALEFDSKALSETGGTAMYHAAFNDL